MTVTVGEIEAAIVLAEGVVAKLRAAAVTQEAPRCATCRWWKPHTERHPHLLGNCELFECHDMEQVHTESKLIVTRTGSGEATIVTEGDFGCVQWKSFADARTGTN